MRRRWRVLNDKWWWGLLAFAAGMIAGSIARIPLLPLPPLIEANAILIGSALGAAITVLGSQWLLTNEHRKQLQLAAASIEELTKPIEALLVATIDTAAAFFPQPNDTSLWARRSEPTQTAGTDLMLAIRHFDSRISNMQGLFEALGPHGVLAFGDLNHISRAIKGQADKFNSLVNTAPGAIASEIEQGKIILDDLLTEFRKILNRLS